MRVPPVLPAGARAQHPDRSRYDLAILVAAAAGPRRASGATAVSATSVLLLLIWLVLARRQLGLAVLPVGRALVPTRI